MDKEITVGGVTEELRNCLFSLAFQKSMYDVYSERNELEIKAANATIFNLVAFGVNSSLITKDEGNDWLDANAGKIALVDVCQKYRMLDK